MHTRTRCPCTRARGVHAHAHEVSMHTRTRCPRTRAPRATPSRPRAASTSMIQLRQLARGRSVSSPAMRCYTRGALSVQLDAAARDSCRPVRCPSARERSRGRTGAGEWEVRDTERRLPSHSAATSAAPSGRYLARPGPALQELPRAPGAAVPSHDQWRQWRYYFATLVVDSGGVY
jgi:hypothetical protein